jgi:hypothetical protein
MKSNKLLLTSVIAAILLFVLPLLLNKTNTGIKLHDTNLKAAKNNSPQNTLFAIPSNVKRAFINEEKLMPNKHDGFSIKLRKFPYPFRAMLSICSDIDGTTPKEFEEYHRYLNTNSKTLHGRGL